jgi:hypothetical protein
MYKEKYLKYKSKYIALKHQLGGNDDDAFQYIYGPAAATITDKVSQYKLMIDFAFESIDIQTGYTRNYTIWTKVPTNVLQLWLPTTNEEKTIFKRLVSKAIQLIEKDYYKTDKKQECLNKLIELSDLYM